MKNLRNEARVLKDDKRFWEAVDIYKNIWSKNNVDKWLGWEYAYCLKKINDITKAIVVCKHTYKLDPQFVMNNDLMAWCVYEKYFRFRKEEYTEHDLKNLEIVAQTIISLIEQKDGSAFEFIVFAIVNIYKKKRDIDSYKKIIDWLDRLNIELLDKEVKSFQNNSGRFIEIQSRKEEYYSIKTKSLLSLEKYAECINCCELAEKDIDKFHYDNDIWIGGRKYYSYGKLGDTDIALAGLKELVGKKNHWSLLFEIAQIYSIKKQREDALDYAYRALLTRDQDKMKIKVLYFVAENLERLEEKNLAKAHYCYYKKILFYNNFIFCIIFPSFHIRIMLFLYITYIIFLSHCEI